MPAHLPRLIDTILPRPRHDKRHFGEREETVDVVEGRLGQVVFGAEFGPGLLRAGLLGPLTEEVGVADQAFGTVSATWSEMVRSQG